MKRIYFVILALFLFACAPKTIIHNPLEGKAELAVAGFSQPVHGWDFLVGGMPAPGSVIPEEILQKLDQLLHEKLLTRRKAGFQGPKLVRPCQEIIASQHNRSESSAYTYWQAVGRCLPVDYLLIPFVFTWQEREGGDWGAERPAHVAFDLNLMEVKSGKVQRFHFDEKQASLTSNLFGLNTFIKRGGKWVLAEDLASDGLRQGVSELGL